jgi:hypothetical protein
VLYDKRVGLHYKRFWLISQTARLANQRPASQKFFRLGSNPRTRVSTEIPNEVLELMTLYPQPVRSQAAGGVEYLPTPRQREAPQQGG